MAGEKIGEAYVELRAKMAKFESELKSAEMLTGKSVGRMQAKFQALAPTFRKVGIGMAVAGGAITAALGLAIKSSIDFNKEMANIATLIPRSTERVNELKGAIRTMAVEVGKDTADLAQGAYQVISAFGDTADTVGILGIAAKAATAGVATTTEAINLLSAVTKGYGDTSQEAVKKASDLAFQTVTLGQTTFPELAASIGRAIPLAAELGVVEEELFTVMATGTGVTGKAAEVSTQLRGIFQSLMAPTADMTKLLESLGYESGKAMLAEEGLHGALLTIVKAAKDSGQPLQKYISQIEGQTLALALTGAQSDTYVEKLAKMRDSVGLTDIAFREQTEGINKAGFAFQQAKIRIGVLGQEIGDRLLPMITPLIERVTEIVKRMSDWSKEHPKLTSALVKFAAVLGPLLIALGGLLMILPGLVAIAPAVGAAFHIMLGPIGLITGAIAAATVAFIYFYKKNETFRKGVQKTGAYLEFFGRIIAEVFKAVGANIGNFLGWFSVEFPNVFRDIVSTVGTILKNLGANIANWVKYLGAKLNPKNWLKKIEPPDWTPLLEGFEATVTEIPKLIGINLEEAKAILKKKLKAINKELEKTGDVVKGVGKDFEDSSIRIVGALNAMAGAGEKVARILILALGNIAGAGAGMAAKILVAIKGLIQEEEKGLPPLRVMGELLTGLGTEGVQAVKALSMAFRKFAGLGAGVAASLKLVVWELKSMTKTVPETIKVMGKLIVGLGAGIGAKAAVALKQNWRDAFKGFTTELWVTFKTIALEKLGLLGDAIVSLSQIIKGDLVEGAKGLGAVFANVAMGLLNSFLGLITETEAYKQLMEILKPVIQAAIEILNAFLQPFLPIIQMLVNAFLPILKALAPIFELLGIIIAGIIIPIFEALWPVIKVVLWLLAKFGQALAYAWMVICKLFGLAGYHAAKEMIKAMGDLADEIWNMENPFDDLTEATEKQTDATKNQTDATKESYIGIEKWTEAQKRQGEAIQEVTASLQRFDLGKLITPVNFKDFVTGVNLGNFVRGVNLGDYVSRITIPSAQVGIPYIPRTMPVVVHREEAVLTPPQAREWREGGTAGTRVIEQHITIQSLIPPDDPILYDRIWREGMKAAYERDSGRRAA